jgi:hypothetical protein
MRARAAAVAIAVTIIAARPCIAQRTSRTLSRPVRGLVFDSVRGRPLGGALVMIDGKSTTTDERGRFHFDSVAEGTQTISVQHAVLDTLGLFGISRRTTINASPRAITVGIPSFETLWHNGCGPSNPPADSGIIYGLVRDVSTQRPVSGAKLELTWSELALRETQTEGVNRVVERRFIADTKSVADGTYAFCGVAPDVTVRVRAITDSAASGAIEIPTAGLRVHRQDLAVGATRARTAGLVVGYLSERGGDPFIDARVSLDDSLEARSEFDGRFVFSGVPTGSHQLIARYIGAAPVRTTIEIVPDDTTFVAMTMAPVTVLTTMNVTSPARASMLREGYEARQISYHRFMLDSTFIGRQPTLANAFASLPNVTLKRTGVAEFTLLVPDRHNGSCTPDLYVDGVMINDFGQLLALPPSRVAGVEVYPFATQIPPELQRGGIRYQCGLVAVWTKWAFRIP